MVIIALLKTTTLNFKLYQFVGLAPNMTSDDQKIYRNMPALLIAPYID